MVNKVSQSSDHEVARSMSGIIKNRKKRNNLCLSDKVKVIDLLKSKKSYKDIVDIFDGKISKSQVAKISADREKILRLSEEGLIQPSARRMKNESRFPEIDEAVLKWFQMIRNPPHRKAPLPVSRAHIQVKARMEARLRKVENFFASDGWFQNWRKRYGIGISMKLFGEAADVDPKEMEPIIEEMRQKLKLYKAKNIFNMDETGLFYRALPNRTYLSSVELRKLIRGSNALKAKDRITLVLCINATGIN